MIRFKWDWKRFAALQVITTVFVVGAIWLGSWVGRSEIVDTQRNGCVRSVNSTIVLKLTNADQDALADVIARLDGVSRYDRIILDAISDRADERIEDLNKRLPPALDCDTAFPDPGPFAVPVKNPDPGEPLNQQETIVVPRRP